MLLALKRLESATQHALRELTSKQLITDEIIVPQFFGDKLAGYISLSGDAYAEYIAFKGMSDDGKGF